MADRWTSLRIDDIPPITVAGELRWKPIRRTLGIEAFGMNAYTAENAGDDVVERHSEATLGHEEAYVVLAGRATLRARRRDARRTRGDGRLPPRPGRPALRERRGAGHDRAGDRRQAG